MEKRETGVGAYYFCDIAMSDKHLNIPKVQRRTF